MEKPSNGAELSLKQYLFSKIVSEVNNDSDGNSDYNNKNCNTKRYMDRRKHLGSITGIY